MFASFTRIKDVGIPIRNLQGYIFILQGPETNSRGWPAVDNRPDTHKSKKVNQL